ncbi:hypothetical protein AVEN_130100-1 [Araneus ventricosus]|uniref:Uncharacterized protein n=1 Tax=Araneus ventricosus TaxID=182803 RepID=A0A4Y2EP01_ARAVE|nr:hypothetical protein AVEN_130100-1 [Araneus ventricosus]
MYVGLLEDKSYLGGQMVSRWYGAEVWRRCIRKGAVNVSSERVSKWRGPSQNSPRVVSKNTLFITEQISSAKGLHYLLVACCEQLEGEASLGVITVVEVFSFIVWTVETKIIRTLLPLQSENTVIFVLTCAHLHNFLRKSQSSTASYSPPGTFNSDHTATKILVLVSGGWKECSWEQY